MAKLTLEKRQELVQLMNNGSIDAQKRSADLDPGFLRNARYNAKGNTYEYDRRPFSNHTWTYSCVNAIARNLKSAPKVLTDIRNPGKHIDNHPIMDLWHRPNPLMSGNEFCDAIATILLLPTLNTPGGQCFIIPAWANSNEHPNLRNGDIPDFLYPFSDRFFRPCFDKSTNNIISWKMNMPTKSGYKEEIFTSEEIIRIRLYNPYDPSKGMSPWYAARIATTQDTKSDIYNTMYYDNGGAVGGVLSTVEELDKDKAEEYLEWWLENFGGAGNNGKTAVLGNGLKYEMFARSNVDMQFIEQKKDNRVRIQAAYGVPDSEIAIFESGMNRATANEASKNFWKKTIIPLDETILTGFNYQWIRNVKPRKLKLTTDRSSVEALQDDFTDSIKNAESLVKSMNVPPAEAFRVLKIPVDTKKYPWLEESFVNSMLVPASTYGMDIPPAKKEDTSKDDKSIQLITNKIASLIKDVDRSKERDALSDSYIREVLYPGERSLKEKMEFFIHKLKREVLDNVDKWLNSVKSFSTVRGVIIDPVKMLFDLNKANEDLVDIYSPIVQTQMQKETKRIEKELGELVNWKVNPENIGIFVEKRRAQLKAINRTTFNGFRRVVSDKVQEAIENNWAAQKLAKEIKESVVFNARARANQAKTIARTEIGSISSQTRNDAFHAENIEEIEWLSARDELVRDHPYNHSIDEETITLGSYFSNGLRFPRDPNGAAGNVINCRCTFIKA